MDTSNIMVRIKPQPSIQRTHLTTYTHTHTHTIYIYIYILSLKHSKQIDNTNGKYKMREMLVCYLGLLVVFHVE